MRTKLIAFELVLLVASFGLFIWSSQTEQVRTNTGEQPDSPAFPNLPVNQVNRIELKQGDRTIVFKKQNLPSEGQQSEKGRGKKKKSKGSRDVTKQKGAFRPDFKPDWVIESYHKYGVRDELVQDRIVKPLRSLKRGEVRSRSRENLTDFGLSKKNRHRIVLKDEANKVIADVVLGTRTTKFEEQRGRFSGGGGDTEYVYYYDATRPEGKSRIRLGQSEFGDLPVDPQEWVFKKIMSFEERDVNILALQQHESPADDGGGKKNEDDQSNGSTDGQEGGSEAEDASEKKKKVEKLYVLRRQEKTGGQNDDGKGDGKGKKAEGDNKDGESSVQYTDWTLHVGDYYGGAPIPLKSFIRLKESNLAWKGGGEKVVRNPVKKEKASQSSADSLFRTLSSLEAGRVEPPLTIGPNQSEIPDKKLKKYGLSDPEGVVYLGRWGKRRGMNVAAFNARYFIGKKNDGEDATYYISSLQTAGVQSAKFFGLLGAQKSRKQIPVYTLSSSDQETLLGGTDLIQTEDEKKSKNGKGPGTSSGASRGSSSEKRKRLKKKLMEKMRKRKQNESKSTNTEDETDSSSDASGSDESGTSTKSDDADSSTSEAGDGTSSEATKKEATSNDGSDSAKSTDQETDASSN